MIVTCALPPDENEIVSLLREKHSEDGIGPFSEAKTRAVVQQGLARDRAMIGVIRSTHIEATVGVYVTASYDSDYEFLSDLWLHVKKDCRKSNHAKDLIDFCRWSAESLGRPLVMARFAVPGVTDQLVALYARRLGKPAGSVFRVNPASAA